MPFRFYDVRTDEMRDLTQHDLDEYQAVYEAYARIRVFFNEEHIRLQGKIAEIDARRSTEAEPPKQISDGDGWLPDEIVR